MKYKVSLDYGKTCSFGTTVDADSEQEAKIKAIACAESNGWNDRVKKTKITLLIEKGYKHE